MTKDHTPFVFGSIAEDAEFTNRDKEFTRLQQNFRAGTNTTLISPRRWGKSSLVKQVAEKMAKSGKIRFCFIDLFNIRDEHEFYEVFARELIRASAGRWEERLNQAKKLFKSIVPQFSTGLDPDNDFTVSLSWKDIKKAPEEILNLPETISKTKKLKLIVCIDEFQNIAHFDDPVAFQKKLRAHWQHHSLSTYCLYGSKRHMLMDIFTSASMPFYKFGDIVFLEKISERHWVEFICRRFKDTGKTIDAELAGYIASLMENHSYFVQQLAQASWFHTKKACKKQHIEDALNTLLLQQGIMFQREVDLMSNKQVNFLRALCSGVTRFSSKENIHDFKLGTSGNVNRIKEALENKEIIDTMEGSVEMLDPLFKLWLQRIYFR